MEKGSELETFVLVLYKVISARLTFFLFLFFSSKKKIQIALHPMVMAGLKAGRR